MILTGTLRKLKGAHKAHIDYALPIGEDTLPLNNLLGQALHFKFTGNIFCSNCGKKTKKSYQQGHCYICATTLARCDICIVRPEKCHFHLNTCREPEWGQTHCMIPHIIYLSNTSHLKVGITRETQIPTRWIDQGATQALPIARVTSRYQAGQLEVGLSQYVRDKTDWRAMLKGENEPIDMDMKYNEIRENYLKEATIDSSAQWLTEAVKIFNYPVLQYPKKIQSINVEKENEFSSVLKGIKGQYLLLEKGVLNIRNLTGYELCLKI